MTELGPLKEAVGGIEETVRVADLRERVRQAMEQPPVYWECPTGSCDPTEPVAVRKARAIGLKLAHMPTDLWEGQLFAGSLTLERPRLHCEASFPEYLTAVEKAGAAARGLGIRCFGHIVPDYPRLLEKGLGGIRSDAEARMAGCKKHEESFLRSVVIALDGVTFFASRLARRCEEEARGEGEGARSRELRRMGGNLRQVPEGPALDFWQALQSVWLLHMVFHATLNANALGRLDQYAGPILEADLSEGKISLEEAAELVDCFCLKFNERAKTTEDQSPGERDDEPLDLNRRTRHYTSSQIGRSRDRIDATNHWLQNIIVGGITPEGGDGTNLLSHLLLRSYDRHQMTNPLITVRVHNGTPDGLMEMACETLKRGGGMPALFNDEVLVPALVGLGLPLRDARDYTNDGCWEVIVPGRTDFRFQRHSVMLCLEWALNRGFSRRNGFHRDSFHRSGRSGGLRRDGLRPGPDTGNPRAFTSYDEVWAAFLAQLDAMIGRSMERFMAKLDDRSLLSPVPLLSSLIDGAIEKRRDMTAGGARYRTFGMLAEGAAHTIDSLAAIREVVFEQRQANMAELCDALDANFEGHEALRTKLQAAPKYGNDNEKADAIGRELIDAFTATVGRHAEAHGSGVLFPCGVATFSWYIGIGEGLGPSPDGRRAGEPVSSNFSPALGRDMAGIPPAILSYSKMNHLELPAGGPLDLRLAKRLVPGDEGTARMAALIRGFVDCGGSMMTLTVADTEELRAAQRDPESYRHLRVRMGGWCAYFTMLSQAQQEHHIRRQEQGG
jgi:formate C-acetyltransferase